MIAETIRDAEALRARGIPFAHIAAMTGVNEITLRDYFASRTVVAPVENVAKALDVGPERVSPFYAPKGEYRAPKPSDNSIKGLCDLVARKHKLPMSDIIRRDRRPHTNAARGELILMCYSAGYSTKVIAKFLKRDTSTISDIARKHATPSKG